MTTSPSPSDIEALARIADDHMDIVVLTTGTRTDGRPFWAYLAIPPSRYEAYKAAEATGNFRLNDFGRILRHGEGTEPPPEVQQEMNAE